MLGKVFYVISFIYRLGLFAVVECRALKCSAANRAISQEL